MESIQNISELPEEPMTAEEVAKILKVPVSWLKAQSDAGNIPVLRAGKPLYFLSHVRRGLYALAGQLSPREIKRQGPRGPQKKKEVTGGGAQPLPTASEPLC